MLKIDDSLTFSLLDIQMPAQLRQIEKKELAYLQIVPPSWMLKNDPLLTQVENLAELYNHGKVVWAAVVQANRLLFDSKSAYSCPAELVLDITGQTPMNELLAVARQLYQLKDTVPDDPELKAYAEHVTNEQDRNFHYIPSFIHKNNLMSCVCFIWRPHLPDGVLSLNYLPVLVSENLKGIVTVLPARFWENTAFYQMWLAKGDDTIETSSAFYQHNKDGTFWQAFEPYIRPKLQELPNFASRPVIYLPQPATQPAMDFVANCYAVIKSDYQTQVLSNRSSVSSRKKAMWVGIVIVCIFFIKLIFLLFK